MSETIGTQLQAARIARQMSIEDVAHQTRIHRDVLCQLEGDDYSKFPNLMFLKSFLKLYSQHIEVDASEKIARLSAEYRPHGEQYLLGGIAPQLRDAYGHLTSRIPVRPILASVAAVALLAVGGSYLVSHLYANGFSEESGMRSQATTTASGTASKPEIEPKEMAMSDSDLIRQIELDEISAPAPARTRVVPTIPAVRAKPEVFEIGTKDAIDPDDIPRAAPVIRDEMPDQPATEDDAASTEDEISAEGDEPSMDISTAEE